MITREGDSLAASHPGFPRRILTRASEATFYDKLGSEWTFHFGPSGQVSHYVLKLRDGRELKSTRLD